MDRFELRETRLGSGGIAEGSVEPTTFDGLLLEYRNYLDLAESFEEPDLEVAEPTCIASRVVDLEFDQFWKTGRDKAEKFAVDLLKEMNRALRIIDKACKLRKFAAEVEPLGRFYDHQNDRVKWLKLLVETVNAGPRRDYTQVELERERQAKEVREILDDARVDPELDALEAEVAALVGKTDAMPEPAVA